MSKPTESEVTAMLVLVTLALIAILSVVALRATASTTVSMVCPAGYVQQMRGEINGVPTLFCTEYQELEAIAGRE